MQGIESFFKKAEAKIFSLVHDEIQVVNSVDINPRSQLCPKKFKYGLPDRKFCRGVFNGFGASNSDELGK